MLRKLGDKARKWRISGLFLDQRDEAAVGSAGEADEGLALGDQTMSDTEDQAQEAAPAAKVFNRQHLVAEMAEKTSMSKAQAMAAVEAMLHCASEALKEGKEVRLAGFGVFQVNERKAGKGRDPRSGAEIDIPESKSVRFRPAKALREMVADTEVSARG